MIIENVKQKTTDVNMHLEAPLEPSNGMSLFQQSSSLLMFLPLPSQDRQVSLSSDLQSIASSLGKKQGSDNYKVKFHAHKLIPRLKETGCMSI